MNQIEELKQKLEKLKQEKINNEKIATEIHQNDVHIIEQELDNLNTLMSDIKKAKKQGKIATIFTYIGTAMFYISMLLFIVPMFADALFSTKMQQSLLSLFGNNSDMMVLILGITAVAGLTSIISTIWSTQSSAQFLMDNNGENIQSQIDEKEKQKELAKQNSRSNEQKLSELDKRQTEINLEIEKCEAKLLLYEELKTQVVNEFINNIDRLEKRETKAYNEFSLEYEDDVDMIDVTKTSDSEPYEVDSLEEAIDSLGTMFKKEINENKGSQKVKK